MRLQKTVFSIALIFLLLTIASISFAKERNVEVILQFDLSVPPDSKKVRVWISYPVSEENQTISDIRITGNFSDSGVYKEGKYGFLC